MNKKAILSLLLLSSIGASTVSVNAGWLDEPTMLEKFKKNAFKAFTKNFTKALPVLTIGMLTQIATKHTAIKIWETGETAWEYTVGAAYQKTKDFLRGEQSGRYLSGEEITKKNNYIKALQKQNAELLEIIGKIIEDEKNQDSKITEPYKTTEPTV